MLHKCFMTKSFVLGTLIVLGGNGIIHSQEAERSAPICWFGISGAGNFNIYDATVQELNSSLTVPAAFHDGNGIRPYGSLLFEYRPTPMWGGMLNVGFDDRSGAFKEIKSPSEMTLKSSIDYVSVEPSLRVTPFSSGFYIFIGPAVDFNVAKSFIFKQGNNPDVEQDWSDVRKVVAFGQAGIGYDIPLTSKDKPTQVELSPFASFSTTANEQVRKQEDWHISTIRAGVALKFGMGKVIKNAAYNTAVPSKVQFSVIAPPPVKLMCKIRETLPLRNYVFFDEASSAIPNRYITLTKDQAAAFKEEDLLMQEAKDQTCRSPQQMNVYYNILNIMGDRLRRNPGSSISLIGASAKGVEDGKILAGSVKSYLADRYGIDSSRITVEGRIKPPVSSEKMGDRPEWMGLCRVEDRRVDMVSNSPELMTELGEKPATMMKPVQIIAMDTDPTTNQVLFKVTDSSKTLTSWSLEITDKKGGVRHFGPYYDNLASISGKKLLDTNLQGDYKVTMIGQTEDNVSIKKESTLHLERSTKEVDEELKFSILFDFDKYSAMANYEKFLTDNVAPFITPNSTVIIHGHTDIIGEKEYNYKLSVERADAAQTILQKDKKILAMDVVKFQAIGYGADETKAPFGNKLPEERCYNRTVIINVIPGSADDK
jgi:outer membrane protein OmpA-like peptidoglycan-associated protein